MDKILSQHNTLGAKADARRRVTRAMVSTRTRELALIAGRAPPHVAQADYEQAKRELTGESDGDLQQAILDALPDDIRPYLNHESGLGHDFASPPDEEDGDGRNASAQLVDDGIEEARRDRSLYATRPI